MVWSLFVYIQDLHLTFVYSPILFPAWTSFCIAVINCILIYSFLVLRIQLWTKLYVSLFAYLFLLIASSIQSYTPSLFSVLHYLPPITSMS